MGIFESYNLETKSTQNIKICKNLKKLKINIFRFINARRRIVQPMIDSNNRAGRSACNVFRNRRRRESGNSPGPSPGKKFIKKMKFLQKF